MLQPRDKVCRPITLSRLVGEAGRGILLANLLTDNDHAALSLDVAGIGEGRLPHVFPELRDQERSMALAGRTILITGAASGIGAATALKLAGPETNLMLAARGQSSEDQARLHAVARAAAALGAKTATAFADLAEAGAARSLVTASLDTFGGLDGIVSNAGFAEKGAISAATAEGFHRAFSVIALAFAELVSEAKASLSAAPAGSIVAVSSFVAHRFRGEALFATSAAAKAALEALVKSAAAELAPMGITVNAVAPGYTRKDAGRHTALNPDAWKEAARKVPLGRIAEAEDIARAIAFLIGPDARYITGQILHVDGGLSL